MKNGCPVLDGTRQIDNLSKDLARALRRLRHALNRCCRCDEYPDCPVRAHFNAQVDIAIQEVFEEWSVVDPIPLECGEAGEPGPGREEPGELEW